MTGDGYLVGDMPGDSWLGNRIFLSRVLVTVCARRFRAATVGNGAQQAGGFREEPVK